MDTCYRPRRHSSGTGIGTRRRHQQTLPMPLINLLESCLLNVDQLRVIMMDDRQLSVDLAIFCLVVLHVREAPFGRLGCIWAVLRIAWLVAQATLYVSLYALLGIPVPQTDPF